MRLLIALGLCLGATVSVAHADDPVDPVVGAQAEPTHSRVVLVSMPEPVIAATSAALEPWSIEVDSAAEVAPASDAAAAAIAQAHGATAVAWLDGDVVVIYDDLKHRTERRQHTTLTGDQAMIPEADAAAIALSIKTTLRQRPKIVASVAPPPEPVEVRVVAAPPLDAAPPQPLHLAARLGAGIPLVDPSPTTARAAVRVSYDVAETIAGPFALSLGAEGGVADTIEATDFRGRYRDLALALGVEQRLELGRGWWLVPSAAATVHMTRLQGDVTDPMERPIDRSSFPYGVEAEVAAETGSHLRAGAALFGTFLTSRDTYKVHGEEVLRVPAATVGIALRMSWQ